MKAEDDIYGERSNIDKDGREDKKYLCSYSEHTGLAGVGIIEGGFGKGRWAQSG